MKKWNQTISEYVGKGHPDRIADEIASIVNKYASTSATEVIINKKGCYISGETTITRKQWRKAKKEINEILENLSKIYLQKKVKIIKRFVAQDKMLAERKEKKIAGDQEIVYYKKLDTNDVHYHLKHIDDFISEHIYKKFGKYIDYKILINLENKTCNISYSKTAERSLINLGEYDVLSELIKTSILIWFGSDIKISECAFEGGSIYNDTGVTGRKLIVEAEGCGYPHGGGAIYGKDNTKTAPYGKKLLQELNKKVLVYFPGDDLDKPNYIG